METNKVVSPYLRVFEPPDEDDSITEFEYVEYLPNDSSNMDKEGDHTIKTRDLDVYLLPHKAVLEVRGRLVKEDGTNYANTDAITITNNGWSLFRSLQYQIDNKIVEDVNQYLPQASTIMNLVKFSDDYSRSTATNMFWYRDTSMGAADLNEFGAAGVALLPADDPGGGDLAFAGDGDAVTGAKFRALNFANKLKSSSYNMGFRSRQLITTGNKSIAMLLPLSAVLGSHRDIDTVMMGMKHTYIIRRSSPDNYIHRLQLQVNSKSSICPYGCPSCGRPYLCRRNWRLCCYRARSVACTSSRCVSIEISSGTPRQDPSGESLVFPASSYPDTSSSPLPTSRGMKLRRRTIKSLIMLT